MSWLAWSLLSAFFAGITAILAKVGVENVNSHLATAIRTTVVLVFTWSIASFAVPAGSMAVIGRRTWLFLGLSGLATGLSWLCYFRALQLGEASRRQAVRLQQVPQGVESGDFGAVEVRGFLFKILNQAAQQVEIILLVAV